MSISNIVIITGMHRSGTTFVGDILGHNKNNIVLHEPYNPEYGLKNNLEVYPKDYEEVKKSWQQVIRLKYKIKRNYLRDGRIKRILRFLSGGKSNLSRLECKIKSKFQDLNLVIKDPFLLNVVDKLSTEQNINSVILIRHPIAIWRSIKRQGWTLKDGNNELREFCELYCSLYENLLESITFNERLMLVKHEELCISPIALFEEIYEHLGFELTPSIRSLIEEKTTNELFDEKKLHNMKRKSVDLAWAWKKRQEPEDEFILQSCNYILKKADYV